MAQPREHISLNRKTRSYAKAVGIFVPGLTRKSFEKYGFSTATLLTDWTAIVGADLAGFTLPERLKWPRNVDAFADTNEGARGRPGATLVLRVDGPRAIDVQYQSAQIIERINAHFGYQAVSEMRFIQAPIAATSRGRDIRSGRPAQTTSLQGGRADTPTPRSSLAKGAAADPTIDPVLAALDRLHANMTRAR